MLSPSAGICPIGWEKNYPAASSSTESVGPLGHDGMYCTIGGRTALEMLEEGAAGAAAIIATGNCSVLIFGTPHMLVWKSLFGFGWPTLPLPITDWLAAVAIVAMVALAVNREDLGETGIGLIRAV